jgi:hypothetical protein
VVVVIWVSDMLSVGSVTVGTGFELMFSQAESEMATDSAIAVIAASLFLKRIIYYSPLKI